MRQFIACARVAFRCRDYKPQSISIRLAQKWLQQFEKQDRRAITALMDRIIYFSEAQTRRILLNQNDAILRKLTKSGLRLRNVIYAHIHEAGSSSPMMLALLRDAARLERLGCKFIGSREVLNLNRMTNELEEGALVYVDDFLGTGNQFCEERKFMMDHVVGNFAEFLLVPCICEEAYKKLSEIGVEVFTEKIHTRAERPLHDDSAILPPESKERLRTLCTRIDRKCALGYEQLASMVVMYRNSPNTLPVMFRGNVDQEPFVGIFPRISDLPKRVVR